MKIEMYTPEEIERYKISHPAEIERILRGVMEKKSLVTAYSENNRDFLVTTLIGLDTQARALYFGYGPDEKVNDALLASHSVSFNTAHDQVRVLFATSAMTRTTLYDEPVLKAVMPAELLRFQRREYYRLPTPLMNPVHCLIPTENGGLETTVADISIGGVSVLAYDREGALSVGKVYQGCQLALPEAGKHIVNLRICTIHEQSMSNGGVSRRAGCQFMGLSPSIETELQRYIIRLERERRAAQHFLG